MEVVSHTDFLQFADKYWDVSDNIDNMDTVYAAVPTGRTFIGAFVLHESHPRWINYSNHVVKYINREHARMTHAEARPTQEGWMIVHPVGDLYVTYA